MDVTFRESEPYYGEKTDLSSLFDIDLDSPSTSEASREGESEVLRRTEDEPLSVVVDSPLSVVVDSVKDEPWRVVVDSVPYPMVEERWRKPNEEENLKVYTGENRNMSICNNRLLRQVTHMCRGSNKLQQVLKLLNCPMT
jgi:hypothetical protein